MLPFIMGDQAKRSTKPLKKSWGFGVKAQAFQADLADEVSTNNLFKAVSQAFPHLSYLVNSASLFEYDRANSKTPLIGKSLQDHMQVNLTAPILLSQLMFEYQKSKSNTSEIIPSAIQLLDQKLINPNPDCLSYTLSKAALLSSVELLAMDFAPHLRVIGLAPGISLPSGDQTNDSFSKAHQMTPLGKPSTPSDIAGSCIFSGVWCNYWNHLVCRWRATFIVIHSRRDVQNQLSIFKKVNIHARYSFSSSSC
uniref:Dehydrogenase-like protein n=1 Tax=Polynucleobacter necessarius subsp. necessarius (strain STIR1) TaxID=452638 RepID=B1XSH0_POLNS